MSALTFRLNLPKKRQSALILGKLKFDDSDREYSATSGLPNVQYLGSWTTMGKGPLPPSDKINEHYEVSTKKVFLTSCTCTEGYLYPILPSAVTADNTTRGNFSLHYSAGLPGSTGCIFITNEDEWTELQLEMEKLNLRGIKSVPLQVVYTENCNFPII